MKYLRNSPLSISAFVLLLLSQAIIAQPIEMSPSSLSDYSDELDALRQSQNLPGLAVALVESGELRWSHGYGFADNNNEIPVTANTPFWIASLTKSFVGLSYLHLENEGKVKFDELAALTPEFTGLCEWLTGTTIPFAQGLDCNEQITVEHILHHQVNKPIGTSFMYNPIMYSRLSRHLEHKLGEGVRQVEGRHNYLAQAIDRFILTPAGMDRTMASMWDSSKADVYFDQADGFLVDEQGYKTRLARPERHIAGGAGIVSTVLDLAKYDIALSTGKIASGEIAEQLLNPAKFEDGSISPYGFGWYFQTLMGEQVMWHSGWDPDNGYSAIHLRFPERQLAMILLANGENLWWESKQEGPKRIEDSEFVKLFLDHFWASN